MPFSERKTGLVFVSFLFREFFLLRIKSFVSSQNRMRITRQKILLKGLQRPLTLLQENFFHPP